MKAKLLTKRVLSVLLVTVMLFSCWVFTAPMQANAAAGKYDLKFTVKDEGNGVDGTKRITTKYKTKANNGTGSETGEISGPSKDISNNSLTSETEVGTVSGVDFPSWVWFQDKCDTGKYPSLTGYLYVRKSGSSNSWSKVATVSKFHDKGWWGSNTGSGSAGTSGYPSANHLAWSSADTSLTVNTDGSNKSSNAYTAILQDQYDVEWHSQPTISYSMSSHTGCSFSTSTRKITLASTANAASNYALTVTASASGYSNLTQSVTINVFGSYYVTFYEPPVHSHDSVYNQAMKNKVAGELPQTVVDYLDYKIINRTIKGEKRYVQQSFIDYDWNYKLTDFKKIEEQNS